MTALVTGASGGLGRGIAVALAAAGHDIGVHYRSDAVGAAAAVASLRSCGGNVARARGAGRPGIPPQNRPAAARRLFLP